MKNYQLIISYRGSAYHGWQIQPNALSIQEVIQQGLLALTGQAVHLIGSGRTDAGVHALGQSAHFLTKTTIPAEKMPLALNAKLPADVRILAGIERPESFHSRYHAIGKTYLYRIWESQIGHPFFHDLYYRINRPLDWDRVEAAAQAFIGTHDFSGFMATGSAIKTTIRRIDTITFSHHDGYHEIAIKGNGFLYNMVRIMIGTLLKANDKNLNERDIKKIILSKDRRQAGLTVPAHGLYLKEVLYPENETFS